jgi:hypothetical protein
MFMSAAKKGKKRLLLETALFGAVTAALYAAVFSNAGTVVELFARGGYYAALPIATVFVFSFAHGSFSGSLWSVLGIEAITSHAQERPKVEAPRPAQRPRPRVRMNA